MGGECQGREYSQRRSPNEISVVTGLGESEGKENRIRRKRRAREQD
jgi:hypothetical protein